MEHTKLPPKMIMLQIGATPMYGIHIEGETSFIATDLTKKDAIYIVQACNAFPAIKERLEKAVCPYCAGPCGKRNPDQHHCTWCDETRAALAAGGEI